MQTSNANTIYNMEIPLQINQLTKRPADSEEDSVVVHFLHSVVLQQDTRVRIHIWPGVLDLAGLE